MTYQATEHERYETDSFKFSPSPFQNVHPGRWVDAENHYMNTAEFKEFVMNPQRTLAELHSLISSASEDYDVVRWVLKNPNADAQLVARIGSCQSFRRTVIRHPALSDASFEWIVRKDVLCCTRSFPRGMKRCPCQDYLTDAMRTGRLSEEMFWEILSDAAVHTISRLVTSQYTPPWVAVALFVGPWKSGDISSRQTPGRVAGMKNSFLNDASVSVATLMSLAGVSEQGLMLATKHPNLTQEAMYGYLSLPLEDGDELLPMSWLIDLAMLTASND